MAERANWSRVGAWFCLAVLSSPDSVTHAPLVGSGLRVVRCHPARGLRHRCMLFPVRPPTALAACGAGYRVITASRARGNGLIECAQATTRVQPPWAARELSLLGGLAPCHCIRRSALFTAQSARIDARFSINTPIRAIYNNLAQFVMLALASMPMHGNVIVSARCNGLTTKPYWSWTMKRNKPRLYPRHRDLKARAVCLAWLRDVRATVRPRVDGSPHHALSQV